MKRLMELESNLGKMYPMVIDFWHHNWSKFTTYFNYSPSIRKLIYTTNVI